VAFDLSTWKRELADRLQGWKPRMQRIGVKSVYVSLCVASLWPVVEALKQDDLAALVALGSVLSGVGGNLVANLIEAWKDKNEADAANQLADLLTQNDELRAELDEVIKRLGVVALADSMLSRGDKAWFRATLQTELAKLGSSLQYESVLGIKGYVNTGGGDLIQVFNVTQATGVPQMSRDSYEAIAERPDSGLSQQEVEQKARRWLRKNIWVKRKVAEQLHPTPDAICLKRWPIIVYEGKCVVKYAVSKYDNPERNGGLPNKFKPQHWKRVERTSKEIAIVWSVLASSIPMGRAEQELADRVIRAANGLIPKVEYDWQVFNLLAKLFKNPLGALIFVIKKVWAELGSSLRESSHPVWPNLTVAHKKLGIASLHYDSSSPKKLHISARESILTELEATIDQEINKAIRRTSEAELIEIRHLGRNVFPFLYPFWVIKTEVGEDTITIVLNGLTGQVMCAVLPIGAGGKLAVALIVTAIILGLGALIVLLTR
jgi:hypothetical protein